MSAEIPTSITFESDVEEAKEEFIEIMSLDGSITLNDIEFPNPWSSVDEFRRESGHIYGYTRYGLDERFMMEMFKTISKSDPDCCLSASEDVANVGIGHDTFTFINHNLFRRIQIDSLTIAKNNGFDVDQMIEEQDYEKIDDLNDLIFDEKSKFENLDRTEINIQSELSKLIGSMTLIVNPS